MSKVLSQTPKKSDLPKIGIIGTTSANLNTETLQTIFVLAYCSERVFDTRKAKCKVWTARDLNSSGFGHRIDKPDVLTANFASNSKPGKDFITLKEAINFTQAKNDLLTMVVLADANKGHSSKAVRNAFGRNLHGDLIILERKYGKNAEQHLVVGLRTMLKRKTEIEACLNDFEKNSPPVLKAITSGNRIMHQSCMRSESKSNLVRLIAHEFKKLDFMVHRKQTEVVISTSKDAEKYMPGLLKKLSMIESTTWTLTSGSGIIFSEKKRMSLIPDKKLEKLIAEAVSEFDFAPEEKRVGNEMPVNETRHNLAPHHDTAMAEAPVVRSIVPEREMMSASQVA